MGAGVHLVAVEAAELADLFALVDEVLERGYLDDAPASLVDGIRGGLAEIRCNTLVAT
jgi:hypothetical protein